MSNNRPTPGEVGRSVGSMKRKAGTQDGQSKSRRAEEDAESMLLASLGSSLRNMGEYEEGVLRTAELDQAPRLTGLGFPSLSDLAPSGRALSDIPHFQSMLSKIRQQLIQQPHSLNLLLQQQMLLNVIHTTTNDHEQCLRPQEEFQQEQARRKRYQRQRQKQPEEEDLQSATLATANSQAKPSLKFPPSKGGLKVASTDNKNEPDADTIAANRLEEIKKIKTVSFAAAAAPRRRIGIQARRRNPEKNVDEETEEELRERKAMLKKLRQDREKRRQKRQRRWQKSSQTSIKSSSTSGRQSEKSSADDDEEEAELEFEAKGGEIIAKHEDPGESDSPSSHHDDAVAEKRISTPIKQEVSDTTYQSVVAASVATVTTSCPLCFEDVEAPTQDALDECLSKHMAECQTSRRPRTRGQRQSSQRAVAQVKSYAEDSGDDDSCGDNRKPAARRRPSRPDKLKTSDVDEESEVSCQNMEEEDDDVLEVDPVNDNLVADGGGRTGGHKVHALEPPTSFDDFDEDEYEDRVDDWIENGIARMRVMKERDEEEESPGEEVYDGGLTIPAWVNDRLFPYQRTGLRWMWELHRQQAGGIIGDEMGLGKTVQLSAFLGCMAASRKLKSILIIAPATMLQHWLSELKIWAPGIRRILIHQSAETNGPLLSSKRTISQALLRNLDGWLKDSRRYRLFEVIDEEDYNDYDPSSFCGTAYALITTYENVRRSPDIWTNHRWSYIVMDEAQKIRNPDADITLVCKRLRTPHRLALSGTPIQNDLRELWSLFDFVFPGRLGTLPAFENEFADPIKRGGYSNASPMQVQLAYRCALVLRDLINPYLLRRMKKDIKEVNRMPGKKEQVLFCRLSNRQRAMYEAFLQSDLVKQVMRGSTQMLGAITMLRKICNHPDLVCPPDQSALDTFIHKGSFTEADLVQDDSEDDGSFGEEPESVTERSGKLEVLAKILPLWKKQGHRVLIFCQWVKMLNIIQRYTDSQGWKFGRLDGKTNVAARQRLVDNFNADTSYFGMLMTTRTGGVGLNLTGADKVLIYDVDWNPQVDAQARERAWRFGQEREVTIYRLIMAGTVEERIYQRQIFKTALSNRILQDPRQKRLFSQKDLKDLFSLKVDGGSIASGSVGLTETGELTKGEGYVDVDQEYSGKDQGSNEDDVEMMQSVLQSKGLAGVFDHDLVESNNTSKRGSVREMEEYAKKAARAALGALKESVVGHDAFSPTWTGSEETQGGRFGESRPGGVMGLLGGAAVSAGITPPNPSNGVATTTSSGGLLAAIRKRNDDAKSEAHGGLTTKSTHENTKLLRRITEFVRRQGPTTEDLLQEFSFVKSQDAAIFRRLLKSVASVQQNGRWRLKRR